MTQEVKLTKGRVALVDDEDFAWAKDFNWQYSATSGEHRQGYAISRPGTRKTVRTIYMHREIIGAQPGQFVDHINGDKLDNRRANLRLCTIGENARNRIKTARNTSGFKGIRAENGKWSANISEAGRQRRVGLFATKIEAARAYDAAAARHYGEFARLNFVAHRDWLLPHENAGSWPPIPEALEAGPPNLDLFERVQP